jgi:RNA polymerase sigma-70 factor (ECF subfamily)
MRHGDRLVALATESPVAPAEDAFDEFWACHHAAVLALAAALTGDWGVAEDLTQDAFSAAHRNWDRIENHAAWVRRVVANRAASHWRRRARETAAFTRLAARPSAVVLAPEYDEFWEKVRALPRRQAQVVVLRYLDDRSVSEIAEVLEIAEGTVKATLSHARAALARSLALEEET